MKNPGGPASSDTPVRLRLPVVADDDGPLWRDGAWRSLEERAGVPPADAGRELPPGVSQPPEGVGRRGFMAMAAGSLSLAGAGIACHRPRENIVPYVRRPPGLVPGNPLHFATAHMLDGQGLGLLVRSYEGRPTKVEGNPDHPDSLGATGPFEQALIMSLYDQDRARQLRRGSDPISRQRLSQELAQLMRASAAKQGAGVRFLVEPTSSPSVLAAREELLRAYPRARFVTYASTGVAAVQAGARLAFGRPLQPRLNLALADVILSIDADFLGEASASPRMQRAFAGRRVSAEGMNRLYVAEPALTVTGMMADHRLRLRPDQLPALALALTRELAGRPGLERLRPLAGAPAGQSGTAGGAPAFDPGWVQAVADDLSKRAGRALVLVGRRQPPAVQALGHALNAALGTDPALISYPAPVTSDDGGPAALGALVGEMAAGAVDTLVITAWNPAFTFPADLDLPDALKQVPTSIYLGSHEDETAPHVSYFIPAAHPLESWGDARGSDGTASVVQPLIDPIWGGVRELELYAMLLGVPEKSAHDLVREHWQGEARRQGIEDVATAWESWLADGVVPGTASAAGSPPQPDLSAIAEELQKELQRETQREQQRTTRAPVPGALTLAFALDPRVHDGRFGNNPWLQELPDPVTKLTWDNAALLSPTTAHRLGIASGDVLRIQHDGREIEAPALIQPGHADDTLTLSLGYGRAGAESVASGVGAPVGRLRTRDSFWFAAGVKVSRTGRRQRLAITQDHWSLEGRDPAVHGPVADLARADSPLNEQLVARRTPVPSLHAGWDYSKEPYRWAMAIDLSRCTGCSACVVACQSENNIPSVGKEEVVRGRGMHWLRIDRYFEGSAEDPIAVTQPMMCQHCELAPCEYVCPVNATVHSDEGLNDMVYNRCIGTRYCSNNCPYKVRRFNYLDFTGRRPSVEGLGKNPEVTVRGRGVMEKCTYCVQRIERARITTRIQDRNIADGELATACEQVCPTGAIVFGSLNDPRARVTAQHGDARRYNVLHELGTKPRTAYLARLRNPNPALTAPTGSTGKRGHE